MKTLGLKDTILGKDRAAPNTPEAVEVGKRNELAYAELCCCLDDKTLMLILYEAPDNGEKSLEILRRHFESEEKPRIVGLYTELTNVVMAPGEELVDYLTRVEKIIAALNRAKETLSDALLVAMVLKGLTEEYDPFTVHVTQTRDSLTFNEFKARLRSFECTLRYRNRPRADEVMVTKHKNVQPKEKIKQGKHFDGECFICEKVGHRARDCRLKKKSNWKQSSTVTRDNSKASTVTETAQGNRSPETGHRCEAKENSSFLLKVNEYKPKDTTQRGLLIDSGASTHIITDEKAFIRFDKAFQQKRHVMELADGTRHTGSVSARGDAQLEVTDDTGKVLKIILTSALLIPEYPQDILSVEAAVSRGVKFSFEKDSSKMILPDGSTCRLKVKDRLYYLDATPATVSNSKDSCNACLDLKEWHEIMGHCNYGDILKLEPIVEGMEIRDKGNKTNQCETCVKGKFTLTRIKTADIRAKAPLELVHTNLGGPISPESFEGYKYAITFVDDYSGTIHVYFLRNKNKAVQATQQFLADMKPFGKVKRLRSDNGTEFMSEEYQTLLRENGIRHERSAPYSPHQNGTAERNWRTLFEMVRCMLIESGLPKELWPHAAKLATVIRNRCYCNRTGETPYFLFTGRKPNLSEMRKFGSECIVFNRDRKKLDPKGKRGTFVGFDTHSPAKMVFFPETNSIQKHRLVTFLEKSKAEKQTQTDLGKSGGYVSRWETTITEVTQPEESQTEFTEEHDTDREEDTQATRTSGRERRKPKYLEDYECAVQSIELDIDYCYRIATGIPQSYDEALESDSREKWKQAMTDEMTALKDSNTFSLVPLPEGKQTVGGRWVFALKEDAKGNETHKARYVAKGYTQVQGVDYYETFSPTANLTSLRVLMQLAAQHNLKLHQMDVKAAYLHAPIDCEVYMEQPQGFHEGPKGERKMVWKLNKSIYGLKQSGRNWNQMLHGSLIKNGFVQSATDNCIYTYQSESESVILLVWVDDIIVAASHDNILKQVKTTLENLFQMKDLGQLTHFLGIDFVQTQDEIKMDQSKYIQKILERSGMSDCKTRATPCETKCDLTVEGDPTDPKEYRAMVGSLIYIMTCTRPDICWIVSNLSRYMSDPRQKHVTAVKHVYRYLKGTQHYPLCYKKTENTLELFGFSDADWANDPGDRKSVTGYCFSLHEDGAVVSWKTKKQQTVALSTCEAECMALAAAVQEALYLRSLLTDMGLHVKNGPVKIFEDNQGTISLAKNPTNRQRSKHVDIKYHFVRDNVSRGNLVLVYCSTENMIADVFTKSATKVKLECFCKFLFGM
uniref:Retrovirus-related Pol poly from transposon TNT 1-94 n=1 Tax=Nothobranchius rachovii TaxID=451742 RepID=A0A1A8PPT4_9TELE